MVIGADGTEVRLVVVGLTTSVEEAESEVVVAVPLLDAISWTEMVEPTRFPASVKVLAIAGIEVQIALTQLSQLVETDWAPSQVPGVSVRV